jgi:nucleoside-diphosphate kinase
MLQEMSGYSIFNTHLFAFLIIISFLCIHNYLSIYFTCTFMLDKTLVILKPSSVQRGLIGEIIRRFERKGLILTGLKMVWLSDEILSEHYAHLKDRPFFQSVKDSMRVCPVIVCCWKGKDAVRVVRALTGVTNGREALPGTIRGDFSMSMTENILHAADSPESAAAEIRRFFSDNELFDYNASLTANLYAANEL